MIQMAHVRLARSRTASSRKARSSSARSGSTCTRACDSPFSTNRMGSEDRVPAKPESEAGDCFGFSEIRVTASHPLHCGTTLGVGLDDVRPHAASWRSSRGAGTDGLDGSQIDPDVPGHKIGADLTQGRVRSGLELSVRIRARLIRVGVEQPKSH